MLVIWVTTCGAPRLQVCVLPFLPPAEVGQDKNRVVGEGLGHLFLMLAMYLKIRWITESIFGHDADCLGALDVVPLGRRCVKFPPYT